MAVTGVMVLGACIGSIGHDTFEDRMRARGGGLDGGLLADAVDAIAADLDVDEVRLRSVTVAPGYVTLQVQVPTDPDELDTYRFGSSGLYGGRGLSGPVPVGRGPNDPPLDDQLFGLETAGSARFDAMVTEALRAAEVERGWASGATIVRSGAGEDVVTTITVTNDRRTATVSFAPDGTLLEVAAR
jgi:hypothetical protein